MNTLPRHAALTAVLLLSATAVAGFARDHVDLNGPWRFAIDPVACGEQNGWHQPAGSIQNWAEVVVPHCWNVDPRFPFTGTAWYRRTFSLPPGSARRHARLNFGGVFYRAKVWLNGQPVGEHEGGYTPFQFDVTDVIHWSGENLLAVEVDNSWDTTTLPGARIGKLPQEQVYPWFEYGGIVRPVSLVLTDPVHVVVPSDPDPAVGARPKTWHSLETFGRRRCGVRRPAHSASMVGEPAHTPRGD